MRILVFAQQMAAFRSGAGTYAFNLAEGLARRGHSVTAVVPDGEAAAVDGGLVRTVPAPRVDPTPGGWIALGRSFARVLEREGRAHDLAHFTDAREAWAVRRPPLPLTGMANDSYALDWTEDWYPRSSFADRLSRGLYYRFLRWAEPRVYRRLDALLCNSEHVARAARDRYGVPGGRVFVSHIGLAEPPRVPAVRLDGDPSVLFVGGNFQRKGLPQLIEAGAALSAALPGLRIHVVGRDRNQGAMERLALRLGVRLRVAFHGWQPNERVRGMMAGASVFALPSITEGFGLVYLEAMMAGTPVVATSVGGASEVFADGTEALFVRPGDARGLAAAIGRIAADPSFRDALVAGGRRAAGRFTVERMAERTEGIFAATAGRPGSGGGTMTGAGGKAPRSDGRGAPPRVIAFGIYSTEPQYPRFLNLLAGLRENGVEVTECHHAMGGTFAQRMASVRTARGALRFAWGLLVSYLSLTARFWRAPTASVVLVGYPGYFHVPLARLLTLLRNRGARVAYDAFFSLHDTLVNDRRLLRRGSLAARAVHALDGAACRLADTVLLDTGSHARFFAREFSLPAAKVAAVPVGPTFPPFPGPPAAAPLSGPFRVVFVGTYIPLHGVDVILGAARLLEDRPDIRLTLAGSGQLRPSLEGGAPAGVHPNVEFVDWVPPDDLPGFLRSFDAALGIFGTSEKAANVIPIKVFDVCAAGLPLVTADTPAVREAFEDGRDALLVPAGDPVALAEAIRRLADDADLRRRLADGSLALARSRFTRVAIGRRLADVLGLPIPPHGGDLP